ncbi:hypothetical protein VCEC0051_002957A, partial [Vibrio cholerae O1 str. EC-0051]
MRLDVYRLF